MSLGKIIKYIQQKSALMLQINHFVMLVTFQLLGVLLCQTCVSAT